MDGLSSHELDDSGQCPTDFDLDTSTATAAAETTWNVRHDSREECESERNTNCQVLDHMSSSSSSDKALSNADDETDQMDSPPSSRSSVSSIPDSVVVHPIDNKYPKNYAKHGGSIRQQIHDRDSPFRRPSSVVQMQMHTEDEDDMHASPSRLVRGPAYERFPSSMRAPESPPKMRTGYRSARKRQTVKKEYPLVLLHCNLLPPSLILAPGLPQPSRRILQEVLPEKFWKRWKLLEEKVVGSGVLRDRGVLISHPQDSYDVLEERLLESLELRQPRLRDGHFLGNHEEDSGEENYMHEDSDSEGEECPDCGRHISKRSDAGKKWEIRVFAANGLMKADAWEAAWKEMEKVDVEVGLWLPANVRTELERRILSEIHADEDIRPHQQFVHGKEDARPLNQQHFDGLDDLGPEPQKFLSPEGPGLKPRAEAFVETSNISARDIDLRTLLINYIKVLASDRRNIAIMFLSILALLMAVWSGQSQKSNVYASDLVRHASAVTFHEPIVDLGSSASTTVMPTTDRESHAEGETTKKLSREVSKAKRNPDGNELEMAQHDTAMHNA